MPDKNIPTVETQMLIRKPVEKVFEAFIDPSITKNFWFTRGSSKLETGKTIIWEWEMYKVSTNVLVKEIKSNERIVIEWGEPATTVEFIFQSLAKDQTYVVIKNYGFHQQNDELINIIKDSTGGFTTVLDGLKAFLEHNINLNLIADKFPGGISNHGN
jgi:uncharacterized protein YndB with AHSA1/START domain